MTTFIIENSYYGILSAVFYSYLNKIRPQNVVSKTHQTGFLERYIEIPLNEEHANRVDNKLREILSPLNYKYLTNSMRSNNEDKHFIIFKYALKIIDSKKDVTNNFACEDIFIYNRLISPIFLEVHRFLGFIRFQKTTDGIYYSAFKPDNDIAELILPHFIKRFKSMPFILHDLNHDVIIGYNDGKYKVVKEKLPMLEVKSDDVSKLFKKYYQTIYIPERKNLKQMLNYMPKRYHKYMPEKNELI